MQSPIQLARSLSLKQLSYFVAVAETLSFTRAAERCFVSQSTLSGAVSELENFLQTALIERDRQRVMLTPQGVVMAEQAKQILSSAADLIAAAHSQSESQKNSLSLGAIPTIAPFLLPSLLKAMRAHWPAMKTLLREAQTHDLLAAVESGELDLALLALPADTGRLQVIHLFDEALLLASAKDYKSTKLDSHGKLRLQQLDMSDMMLMGDGHCLRDHVLTACQGRKAQTPSTSSIEATSLSTLVQMVDAGLGISLLPEMAVNAGLLRGTKVQTQHLHNPQPQREIALVLRPTSAKLAVAKQLAQLANTMHQPKGKAAPKP